MDKTPIRSVATWRVAFVLFALVFVFTGHVLVHRFVETTQANVAAQQKVIHMLGQLVQEVQAHHAMGEVEFQKTATTAREAIEHLVEDLRSSVGGEHLATAMDSLSLMTKQLQSELVKRQSRFSPMDRVADRGTAVTRVVNAGNYTASPSIVKLPSGRLLVVLERSVVWGDNNDALVKLVFASDNAGSSWFQVGTLGPMNWPQIVQCKSGVYVIGTEHHFRANNNVVVSRMLDDRGASWSAPVLVTRGWSVVAANTGVDVSHGRVTKTFEMIPSMADPVVGSRLRKAVTLPFRGGPGSPSWQHSPVLELELDSVTGFVPFTMVQAQPTANATAPAGEPPAARDAFFFRILAKDTARGVLTVRLERFNHYWATSPVTLVTGQMISPGSGSNVYGGVDWVAMAMSASETDDLTNPAAWTMSDPVGNPASVYANEMRVLFDVAFRPDRDVQEGIVGRPLEAIRDNQQAFEAGFGSLYWMEGVVTRLQDRHGGPGTLLSVMRVNNDLMCDLAALVEFDDRDLLGKGLTSRFLRYTNIPGLAVGHPAILYDNATDLYWMASNANRDSVRAWRQPSQVSDAQPGLHITPFSKCEVDRSTLVLYYSPNLVDWMDAGVIDYHIKLSRHFAYPHMTIDGEDLLVVSRAAFAPWSTDSSDSLPEFFNNHNSNAISFHRVRSFRTLANVAWATEQGPYSGTPRKTTNSVASLVQTLLPRQSSPPPPPSSTSPPPPSPRATPEMELGLSASRTTGDVTEIKPVVAGNSSG